MVSESNLGGANIQLEFFERFLALIPELAVIATPDGSFRAVNPAWTETLGYTRDELRGMSFPDVVHPDDLTLTIKELASGAPGAARGFVNRCRDKHGVHKLIDWRAEPVIDESIVFATGRDITERRQAQARLEDKERQLSTVYESVSDALFLLAVEGLDSYRFLTVNRAFLRLTGLSEDQVRGKYLHEVIPPPALAAVLEYYRRAIDCRSNVRWEEVSEYPAGTKCGEVSVTPIFDGESRCTNVVGTVRDLTERNRSMLERAKLEEQLFQAQKMESIGRLAGGVAHDFNNLLTVINGYSDLLRRTMSQADPLLKCVTSINDAGRLAARLTQQLLAFSRCQVIQPRIVDLNSVIREAKSMLERLIGEDTTLVSNLPNHQCRVLADPDQIHQVLMNLVANARDAMPQGGRLIIETRELIVDPGTLRSHPEAREGHFVVLIVQDTGFGMDESTMRNIFEPFFTTKERGKGTGLGLSAVYGIVHKLNGWIEVESKLGLGTVFRIYMPRRDEDCNVEADPDFLALNEQRPETILLVEDHDDVRGFAKSALALNGYQVIEAANAGEAMALSERHTGVIDIVITDVVMPGMNGRELVDRLRIHRPEMKILFMSGHTAEVILQRGVSGDAAGFLLKPFTAVSLAARVLETLTGPGGHGPQA